ncbi:uncharacterized protein LOC109840292 isoform X2 [Asparagus officinalis]|uniref:uncharacterized protein LOC109840292 isoform X2 n=1 Tax=Asparagus officinalis TaxID=4686 RepID=UPI00098E1D35|nr:uncharacterized protein LOC109840292 isoform X2 [Asparagus officinalis]
MQRVCEEGEDEKLCSFSNVRTLLASRLLEGVPVTYIFKKHKAELHGFIKGDGYRCGCSVCDYKQVVSADEFEKHAGVTSSHANNHIYLANGKSLHEVVKDLIGVPLESVHEELKAIVEMDPNIYDASKDESAQASGCEVKHISHEEQQTRVDAMPSQMLSSKFLSEPRLCNDMEASNDCQTNSSLHDDCESVSCEADSTPINGVKQNGTDGITRQEVSTMFIHQLPLNLSIVQKTTQEEPALSTPPRNEKNRPYQESDQPSPRNKNVLDPCSLSQNMVTEFSPEVPKHQKIETEFLKKNLDVRSLLRTGLLSGRKVKYMKDQAELDGLIHDEGYLCGCLSCNYKKVVSALKFEIHAGAVSKNQNNYIYLENGISICALVKKLNNAPKDSLRELIEKEIPCPDKDPLSNQNGSFQTASIAQSKNSEENQLTQTIEIQIDPHLVEELSDSTSEGCKSAPSSINVMFDSPLPHIEGNSSYTDVNISPLESAKVNISPGSNIALHGQKSSVLETRYENRKRPMPSPICSISGLTPSSNMLESDIRPVHRMVESQGSTKKRTGDLHKIIFNILQDGAMLFYCTSSKTILEGQKMGNGILCSHCDEVVSPSTFEAHAGFDKRRQPYRNIYTSSGSSLHDLTRYLSKNQTSACMICGGREELVSCIRCAKAFHPGCYTPDADSASCCLSCKDNSEPETTSKVQSHAVPKPFNFGLKRVIKHPKDVGCALCGDSSFEMGKEFGSKSFVFCGQCEKLYHVGCLKDQGICDLQERPLPWFSWLCSIECQEVHNDLRQMVLTSPHEIHASTLSLLKKTEEDLISEGEPKVNWQLLSGAHKTCDNEMLFSKATAIFQETFGPILENGYNLIPAMVEGQEMAKQYYGGMYCAVITEKSEVVSAGLIRIFGRNVAELPLIATRNECQGKGYFQALLSIIEQLMIRLKVKCLVLPTDEFAQSIWINKFGFIKMAQERVKQYADNHWILMFKKKIMLEKALRQSQS